MNILFFVWSSFAVFASAQAQISNSPVTPSTQFTLSTEQVTLVGTKNNGIQEHTTTKWPSLQFNFTLKRRSMEIHATSEFSVIADPVMSSDGDYVLYNNFATFNEGEIVHNYTFVNGATYYSSMNLSSATLQTTPKCLESPWTQLPSINTLVAAVNEATPVSHVRGRVECRSGHIFKVSVHDDDFTLCSSESGFKMYGSDVNVSVKYLQASANIPSSLFLSKVLPECGDGVPETAVTSTGKSLLTGNFTGLAESRKLRADFSFVDFILDDSSACVCKSTPRPCIFIHGMGVQSELQENQDSLEYWGDLTGHTPCCSTIKYAVLDTINNAWTDATLQQKVCDRALAVSQTSMKTTISDTIIISHSMGNLMLAGAIATGKCAIASSSTWVALGAPMKGSKASEFLQESCAGYTNFLFKGLSEISGRCPPTVSVMSMPYQGESYSSPELDAAFKAAQDVYRSNVYAVMCSESFSGLASFDHTWLWTLGNIGHHHSSKNDGMVEFDSCAAGFPESKFGTSWRDKFYKTKLNHNDMRFKHGDSMFNEAQMPVKWFECLL